MTNEQKRDYILLTYVITLLNRYSTKEKTRLHRVLTGKIIKHINKMHRLYSEVEIDEAIHKADRVWKKVTDMHDAPVIEISTLLGELYGAHEQLHKLGISKSNLSKFMILLKRDDAVDIQKNSRAIALDLLNGVSEEYGLEIYTPPKLNFIKDIKCQ